MQDMDEKHSRRTRGRLISINIQQHPINNMNHSILDQHIALADLRARYTARDDVRARRVRGDGEGLYRLDDAHRGFFFCPRLLLQWPGYPPWHALIRTKTWSTPQRPLGPITREELARRLARSIARFLDVRGFHHSLTNN